MDEIADVARVLQLQIFDVGALAVNQIALLRADRPQMLLRSSAPYDREDSHAAQYITVCGCVQVS